MVGVVRSDRAALQTHLTSAAVLALLSYSELTKTSTVLPRLAVTCALSAARCLVLIFVNPLYLQQRLPEKLSSSLWRRGVAG